MSPLVLLAVSVSATIQRRKGTERQTKTNEQNKKKPTEDRKERTGGVSRAGRW